MGIQWKKFHSLQAWRNHNGRWKHSVIGNTVYWEKKRDGSNHSLLFHKGFPMFYTHYKKTLADNEVELRMLFKPYMKDLEGMLGERYIMYFELLREGKSPAGFEFNPKRHFKAFDIWDIDEEHYLHPIDKYKLFRQYHIPHTACCKTSIHDNTEDFEALIDKMIDIAHDGVWEGYVAKWWHRDRMYGIKVKVDHKYGKPSTPRKVRKVDPRPTLERSEVCGAIDCVFYELNREDFLNVKIAMPLIAKGVSREEKKHGKKNRINLYHEYLTYLGNIGDD